MWSTKIIVVLDAKEEVDSSRLEEVVRKYKDMLENALESVISQ